MGEKPGEEESQLRQMMGERGREREVSLGRRLTLDLCNDGANDGLGSASLSSDREQSHLLTWLLNPVQQRVKKVSNLARDQAVLLFQPSSEEETILTCSSQLPESYEVPHLPTLLEHFRIMFFLKPERRVVR